MAQYGRIENIPNSCLSCSSYFDKYGVYSNFEIRDYNVLVFQIGKYYTAFSICYSYISPLVNYTIRKDNIYQSYTLQSGSWGSEDGKFVRTVNQSSNMDYSDKRLVLCDYNVF